MPATVACPHCRTTHTFPDQMVGKRARCRQCLSLFLVSSLAGVGTPVDDVEPQGPAVKARPAPPRRRYEDDHGPEPVRKSGGNGLLIGLLVGCGAFLLVLVLGGGAVGAWLYFSYFDEPVSTPAAQAPQPAQPPPQPKPPDKPGPSAKPAFTLSNAKVTRVGSRLRVSVDLRPDGGPPVSGQQFNLLIRSAGGGTYHSVVSPLRLRGPGTLRINLGSASAASDQGPFEITLELGPPGRNATREPVSNTVSARP